MSLLVSASSRKGRALEQVRSLEGLWALPRNHCGMLEGRGAARGKRPAPACRGVVEARRGGGTSVPEAIRRGIAREQTPTGCFEHGVV